MVIKMAKLRMAHASTHGARKPPGPKIWHTRFSANITGIEKFPAYKMFLVKNVQLKKLSFNVSVFLSQPPIQILTDMEV